MTTTTTTYSAPASRSLPLGVAILAILLGIYGFFVFLIGLLIAVGSTFFSSFGGANPFSSFGYSGVVGGLIVLIIGLIILGLAVALWNLRLWALVLTVLFLIVVVVIDAIGHNYSFGFFVGIILLIYLLAVSRHFT